MIKEHGDKNKKNKSLRIILSNYKVRITVTYSLIGLLWISITNFCLIEIIEDKHLLKGISFIMGLVSVIWTAGLIYFLIRKGMNRILLYQNELHKNEEVYKSLYHAVSGGIVVQNPMEEVININSEACEMLGFEASEMIGKKLPYEALNTVHVDGSPFLENEYPHKITLSTGKNVRQTIMGITNKKTREKRWILINTEPIINGQSGELEADMATFLDITEWMILQDKLSESEQLYRNIFNSMNEGFALREIICGSDGNPVDFKYIDFNKAYERITGLEKDKTVDRTISKLVPDFEKEWIDIYGRVAQTGESARFQGFNHSFDKYLEVMAFCPEKGKFATVILDVTERVIAEKEIKKLNEELENRVLKRTEQLETANKELEAFSYSVSHDLRAPLRAIEGFSKIIAEDYNDKLDSEGMRYLNIISKNTVQMGQLIDDLLSFSRMSRSSIGKEEVDMNHLVKMVFDELTLEIKDREIVLDLKDLPKAHGDYAMLKQVLVNLISNSIKFTKIREKAIIEAGCMWNENEKVFYIKDNGVGFDMKYVDKLFGVFQRLHRADEYEGTGIGLAIVQRIISRHGGRVWAEGRIDEGTTIYFTLYEGESK